MCRSSHCHYFLGLFVFAAVKQLVVYKVKIGVMCVCVVCMSFTQPVPTHDALPMNPKKQENYISRQGQEDERRASK